MASAYGVDSGAVALTAATAKSAVIVSAASNAPLKVIEFSFGCDATATGLIKVEFLVGTITGGTAGTAPNKSLMNSDAYQKAPLFTATGGYTAEPTYTKHASNDNLVVKTMMFAVPMTEFDIEYPLGREWYLPESNVLALRFTSTTVAPNVFPHLNVEEG